MKGPPPRRESGSVRGAPGQRESGPRPGPPPERDDLKTGARLRGGEATGTSRARTAGRAQPIGAEVMPGGGVAFRVWAPQSRQVAVQFYSAGGDKGALVPLTAEPDGYFSGLAAECQAGARYKFRLDHGEFPDPASRFQPEGPFGASQVVDPAFAWSDHDWKGRDRRELVVYEMHLGTFTPGGTWAEAREQLPELARLGITALEIMPVAEFAGDFGWGYDGVDLFAPSHLYGTPQDARAFIDRAHQLGLMVIFDVVYNHLGPEGNFLAQFAPEYFSRNYTCEWGQPINFDGERSAPVREFFLTNARYWVREFHVDGLRFDATQQVFDASPRHILTELAAAARHSAGSRRLWLVAENESQHSRLMRTEAQGGNGLDAMWNDDFHHAALVVATGRAEAYYLDYRGSAQEFVSAALRGFLFQGQWSRWQRQRRGTPALDLEPHRFVCFLQNHDQVANTLRGLRLPQLTSPATVRALTGLLLLQPATPLLFQGQEFGASSPFLYFADNSDDVRPLVARGRAAFLRQFRTIATSESRDLLDPPSDRATFLRSKLDLAEREKHRPIYRLHEDLLRIRRQDAAVHRPDQLSGAVLGERAFVLRFHSAAVGDRLLVVNLGDELHLSPAPEPLLAPLSERGWRIAWSSEAPRYGGDGTPALETIENWILPPHATVLLQPDANTVPAYVRLAENR